MARRQGATDAQLEAVARADYATFDEPWAAALRFADVLTPTPGLVPDAAYQDLATQWNAAEIVEITAVICMYNFFNRFAHALDIPKTV